MTVRFASRRVLLINPNANAATTEMMVTLGQQAAGDTAAIIGATAARGPRMILEPEALAESAAEVARIAAAGQHEVDGIIVAAFGDPGLASVRERCPIPAVGIAESGMLEAAAGGRRFGVATTTPALAPLIDARADELGLNELYTGVRLTRGEPDELVGDPERLVAELADAVRACIDVDGADAVVIGGGPLGAAAKRLERDFARRIVQPIPAAVRRLLALLPA